jgi:hypothetical protein
LFPVATNYNDVWKKGSTPLKKWINRALF